MKGILALACLVFALTSTTVIAQQENYTSLTGKPANLVNVFLGSSGDHGQMSPAASYPFGMLSIGPQTYPTTHMGYEYLAKKFDGFTHTRFEGVGCTGSGGLLLIKPFLGDDPAKSTLIKVSEKAGPGYYAVGFDNQISAKLTVLKNAGKHVYQFPKGKKGFYLDLSHAFSGGFIAEEHKISKGSVSGWIDAKTTCGVGKYRIFYYLELTGEHIWQDQANHKLDIALSDDATAAELNIAVSAVSLEAAKASINKDNFDQLKNQTTADWNALLGKVAVEGDIDNAKLFYSLLYRTMQSPYMISEPDGQYRSTKGVLEKSKDVRYNGWAIWDNYRTQLPLLSLVTPDKYAGMITSLADLYNSGKKDYATQTEPSNTVRSEHAIVVLLDAYRKGYKVDFKKIADSLMSEVERLDYKAPDKALESSYDAWAMSEIYDILKNKEQAAKYRKKALEYKTYWQKDFSDMSRRDVDQMQARGLYQGTIWQYRWFVPYDVKGLIALNGGEAAYVNKLDEFFERDLYNHANEPDLQVPLMYNMSKESWKSQDWMHRFAADTVIQNYFNDNSRGIGSNIGRIYQNQPEAYLRTMDDDAGAMSAWYVFTASGFSPACVGWPIYYLNVPLFKSVVYQLPKNKTFKIEVDNFSLQNKFMESVYLNGKLLKRNYLTQEDIMNGGVLRILASKTPVKDRETENWVSSIEQ
ncbi:putative alpha-1,2-mannosidase [Pedobacter sp. UYP24]